MQILVFLSSPIWSISKTLFFLTNCLAMKCLMQSRVPFAVGFAHTQPTCANNIGLLNLPLVETTSFDKNSIKYNALLSWNFIQSLLPAKLSDFEDIKSDFKKCLVASY